MKTRQVTTALAMAVVCVVLPWQPWRGRRTTSPPTGNPHMPDQKKTAADLMTPVDLRRVKVRGKFGRRIVMLANWNKFGGGHFLQPSALVGFGYLDALREIFTDGGPHEDPVPTDQQKRRFTVLFAKTGSFW